MVNELRRLKSNLALNSEASSYPFSSPEVLFETLLEGLGEGIIFADPNDIVIHVNSRMAQMLGFTTEEMIGQPVESLLLPPSESETFRAYTQRRLEGISEHYEVNLMRKDGSRFWAEINATPIWNLDGEIVGTLGAITDISERKSAEEALRESEEHFRAVTDTAPVMIWESGPDKQCTYFNKIWLDFTGRTLDEEIGMGWVAGIHPEDLKKCLEIYESAFEAREEFKMEYRLKRADGQYRWVFDHGRPTFYSDGSFQGYLGSCIDITDQKKTEAELRGQKAYLQSVIDINPNPIFTKNQEGKITLANQAFADIYGVSPKDLIGKTDKEIHPFKNETEVFIADDKEVLKTLSTKFIPERPMTNPVTGEIRWFHSIKRPLLSGDGHEPQVLAVATDITDRKIAEAENLKLQRQLLQSQKMEAIGQLAAGIAHDLNNALSAVVGHLELLETTGSNSTNVNHSVEVAKNGCQRALLLITQLLGFSRQGKYNLVTLNVDEVLSETVDFLSKVLGPDHRTLIQNRSDLYIEADRAQFQQMLTNLIINAKHSMKNGGDIIISSFEQEVLKPKQFNPKAAVGDYVVICVSDSGHGISKENLDKIFEPFFTTKAEGKGTGLGLSMVYGSMQNHGGWVDVESEVGKGSKFYLYFPKKERSSGEEYKERISEKNQDKTAQHVDVVGGKVLVIDDEPSLLELSREFFKIAGIEIECYSSAKKALEWYKTNHSSLELVILDMRMPELGGLECYKFIREINPSAKVIIMTGYIQDSEADYLVKLGAVKVFQKPLNYSELVKWVKKAFKH